MADIEVVNRETQKLVAIACPGCGQLYSVEATAAKRVSRPTRARHVGPGSSPDAALFACVGAPA